MALIQFENKPSTNTPINATNLNGNFSELKDNIDNLLYYKPGDSFSIDTYYHTAGIITNGSKTLQFSFILPKLLDKITTVTINEIYLIVIGIDGYIISGYSLSDMEANGSYTIYKENNRITIYYILNEVLDVTNNTPVGVYLRDTNIQFS